MKYITPKQYASERENFGYPSDEVSPELKKQKEYFLAVMNAQMADYYSNYCYIPYEWGTKRTFTELQAYARGHQPVDKLKQSILGKKRKDGRRITKMNVSWDTYYKLAQLFDVMREKNMKQEYDVDINCIDNDSIAAKNADKELLKFLIDRNTQDFLEQTSFKPNFQIDPQAMGMRTEADVDIYFETGGYTTQWEIAAKAACSKTKIESNYKVLQDATFDDLITNPLCGITGWKTYIDPSTKIPKIRKVIAERAVVPYSDYNDFNDITRGGEFRIMSLADVRKENPSLTPNDIYYLAQCFQWLNAPGLLNRLSPLQNGTWSNADKWGADPVSRAKVLVLDYQWLSVDIETNIKNVFGNGGTMFKPVKMEYELDNKARRNGEQKIQKKVIRKYYSQWVVGTEYFLSYGTCEDTVYYGEDGNKTPRIDFFFTRTGNASLVERAVAIIDDIDLAIMKQRNALATMPAAPAMAIQKDLLENVFLNGILQQPEDIVQGLIERGILYYNGLDDEGKPLYFAGGQKPIDFLDLTKIAGMLGMYGTHIANKVNELREMLGLQNGADAGATSPYQGLGQTELAFQSANASLYPTFNAYNYLFKAAFNDILKKWQIVAKDKDIPVNYSILGNKNLEIIKLSHPFSVAEFNADITIAPSVEERQRLLADITQLKALGTQTNGAQGLTTSEYMYVWKKVMAGNIDEAMFVLAQIEKYKKLEAQQQVSQNQQANIQDQQASAQQKLQGDLALQSQGDENKRVLELLRGTLATQKMLIENIIQKPSEGKPEVNASIAMDELNQTDQIIGSVMAPPQPQEEVMVDETQQSFA